MAAYSSQVHRNTPSRKVDDDWSRGMAAYSSQVHRNTPSRKIDRLIAKNDEINNGRRISRTRPNRRRQARNREETLVGTTSTQQVRRCGGEE